MDTVIQWNIRGFRSNFEELKLLLKRSQSAVVALQEGRLGEGQLPSQGYTLLPPQGGSHGAEVASENWPACCSCHNKPGKDSIPASQYLSFETLSG
ncbi:hypothetical protein PoB_004603000 [Plakobranchus ocellatus]|uniref:Endonuclease/exonuclease/phosphatase domain-containing protein n=1 Tax=Plakobranchus ocellatus TaxID=259542 RepID=A0AAV4BG46_9GAST|nr:hypothetical protein PoB_004603000 [Plakobranchus ocellatus]